MGLNKNLMDIFSLSSRSVKASYELHQHAGVFGWANECVGWRYPWHVLQASTLRLSCSPPPCKSDRIWHLLPLRRRVFVHIDIAFSVRWRCCLRQGEWVNTTAPIIVHIRVVKRQNQHIMLPLYNAKEASTSCECVFLWVTIRRISPGQAVLSCAILVHLGEKDKWHKCIF